MRTRVALLLALVLGPMLLATPTLAADLPAIKARGQLIAATSGNLPPVTFLNDKNELTGYDIEVGARTSTKSSISTDTLEGRAPLAITERTCAPRSPNSFRSRSEAPSMIGSS